MYSTSLNFLERDKGGRRITGVVICMYEKAWSICHVNQHLTFWFLFSYSPTFVG